MAVMKNQDIPYQVIILIKKVLYWLLILRGIQQDLIMKRIIQKILNWQQAFLGAIL